jgi:hypothetical protein
MAQRINKTMKTFKEFAKYRGWIVEDDQNSQIASDEIVNVGNDLAKRNPKIVPGLTPVNIIKQAMGDAKIKKLVGQDPKAAGAVGAYLGGPDAVKQMGIKNQ